MLLLQRRNPGLTCNERNRITFVMRDCWQTGRSRRNRRMGKGRQRNPARRSFPLK